MATAESAIAGKNYQDTFHAIYENVMTEKSNNDAFHTNTEPAKTQGNTRYTAQASSEPGKMGETNPDILPATSNGAEPTTVDETPPASVHANPKHKKTEASTQPTSYVTSEPPMGDSKQDIFHGWFATDATSPLKHQSFTPKTWEETDVDIKVTHCGVCASDLHTMRSGWGETLYPVCCGHEIVGVAIRVGSHARPGIKIGDRVGVGPQGYNCHKPDCSCCMGGRENYCPNRIGTYGERYPSGAGISYGGFADSTRHNSNSVFNIPSGLDSSSAAVMLCAGATVYEPLKEHGAAAPGKRVGVIGLGGLGHLSVLFAKTMGCQHVVAVSRSEAKRSDALALGADAYIATADEKGWGEKHASSLDLIICTVSDPRMPLKEYLGLLRPKGTFCQVGIPEGPLPQLDTMALVLNGTSVCFSDSASPGNVREMLGLAAEKGVRAWTETRPMGEIGEVVGEMEKGRARFRFVMVNEGNDER